MATVWSLMLLAADLLTDALGWCRDSIRDSHVVVSTGMCALLEPATEPAAAMLPPLRSADPNRSRRLDRTSLAVVTLLIVSGAAATFQFGQIIAFVRTFCFR